MRGERAGQPVAQLTELSRVLKRCRGWLCSTTLRTRAVMCRTLKQV